MALNPVEIVGGIAIGTGVGGAVEAVVEPQLQDLKNTQWQAHQDVPIEPDRAAEIAAEDVDLYDRMATEASFSGVDAARFRDLWGVTLTAPGEGTLLNLLRRSHEVPIDFAHGLRKAKLETQWDAAIANLQHARLSPAQLALGIVRSVVADPGLLAVTLDTSGGVVPAYPVWPGDTLAEALTGGFDSERLRVLVGEIGLPMSAQQAASAYFRGIIKHGDFNRAILEGDTRPEWAPFILDQARQIPTVHEFVEGRLRAWIDDAAMFAGAARHGMSQADTDLIFKTTGRPLSFHQVFIGERRGGVYGGPTTAIDPAFLKSLQESSIRPEWYDLAWAQRYTYPTAFVLRSLTEAGDLTQQETHDILLFEGWEPTLAAKVSARWAATPARGGAAKIDPWVSKADTHLWTAVQKGYIGGKVDVPNATISLDLIGVSATAQAEVFARWDETKRIEAL